MSLGTTTISHVVVNLESLVAASSQLGAMAAYAQRVIAATLLIAESLSSKSHHVGSSVFDTLLFANFISKTTDVSSISQRDVAGLLSGLGYFSGKSRTMGLTFLQAALVNRASGSPRHVALRATSRDASPRIKYGRSSAAWRNGSSDQSSVEALLQVRTLHFRVYNDACLWHCLRGLGIAFFRSTYTDTYITYTFNYM